MGRSLNPRGHRFVRLSWCSGGANGSGNLLGASCGPRTCSRASAAHGRGRGGAPWVVSGALGRAGAAGSLGAARGCRGNVCLVGVAVAGRVAGGAPEARPRGLAVPAGPRCGPSARAFVGWFGPRGCPLGPLALRWTRAWLLLPVFLRGWPLCGPSDSVVVMGPGVGKMPRVGALVKKKKTCGLGAWAEWLEVGLFFARCSACVGATALPGRPRCLLFALGCGLLGPVRVWGVALPWGLVVGLVAGPNRWWLGRGRPVVGPGHGTGLWVRPGLGKRCVVVLVPGFVGRGCRGPTPPAGRGEGVGAGPVVFGAGRPGPGRPGRAGPSEAGEGRAGRENGAWVFCGGVPPCVVPFAVCVSLAFGWGGARSVGGAARASAADVRRGVKCPAGVAGCR